MEGVSLVSVQVLKAVMLFPTIEWMAQTPQGKVMTPVLCQLRYLAYLPVFLLSLLPDSLRAGLITLVFRGVPSLDRCVVQPSVELLSGDCGGRSSFVVENVPNQLFLGSTVAALHCK